MEIPHLQMVRMEMLVELYSQTLNNLLETQGMEPNLEANKWYTKKITDKP